MTQELNCAAMLRASEAIDNRDYSAAFELLVALAAEGNPKAELNLATFYHLGLGVPRTAKRP
jgi:TPR repeat protein